MNYTTQCREMALATRHRIKIQFGLSLEQGPVEAAFKEFADQIVSVCKSRSLGTPIQKTATFNFVDVCGVTAEELASSGEVDTTVPVDELVMPEVKKPTTKGKKG